MNAKISRRFVICFVECVKQSRARARTYTPCDWPNGRECDGQNEEKVSRAKPNAQRIMYNRIRFDGAMLYGDIAWNRTYSPVQCMACGAVCELV